MNSFLKEPRFWFKKSIMSWILSPLGCLYQKGSKLRLRFGKTYKSKLPVICIGNIHIGGVGKTPLTLWIADYLRAQGHIPHIITRGYRRTKKGSFRVESKHSVEEVGDESFLMSQYHPVWVAESREEAARLVEQSDATHILLDDGMQDPSLQKDLTICVIDGQIGFGNGFGIPAGPLRESLKDATNRIDWFCIMGGDESCSISLSKPIIRASLRPHLDDCVGKKILPFAGIGRPEKFFQSLNGLDVQEKIAFADHYIYSTRDIEQLRQKAQKENARLVTTEKDFVRVPCPKDDILCVKAELVIEDAALLKSSLDCLIK